MRPIKLLRDPLGRVECALMTTITQNYKEKSVLAREFIGNSSPIGGATASFQEQNRLTRFLTDGAHVRSSQIEPDREKSPRDSA